MDGKTLARIAAVIFVAVAVTATAVEMTRKQDEPESAAPQMLAPSAPSPVREGLRRCQGLGQVALQDRDCLRLWAELRDRFVGLQPPPTNTVPEPVTPQSSNATAPGAL